MGAFWPRKIMARPEFLHFSDAFAGHKDPA
jgi:hypothetical protein